MLARRLVLRRALPSYEVPRRWVVAAAEARWDLEAPPSPQRHSPCGRPGLRPSRERWRGRPANVDLTVEVLV